MKNITTMNTVFIIHGAYSKPRDNWFPWLRGELGKQVSQRGLCFIPLFPTPHNQSLESWMTTFKPFLKYVNEHSVFIGHSIGCAFILDLFERLKQPVAGAILVGGFVGPLNNPTFDTINVTFYEKPFDWETILKKCKQFVVINSDNDPFVPLRRGKEIAQNLKTELTVIEERGHFNNKEFPELLELLCTMVTQR